MKINNSIKLVLLCTFFAIQCKNTGQQTSNKPNSQLFSLKTSECMGTCPVFTFTVFPDRSCTYQGFANVNNIGTFSGTLSSEELNHFKSILSESDFYNITVDNNSLVKDLPTQFLFYNDGSQQKTITYYDSSNKNIDKIIKEANRLIEKINWDKN